MVAEAALLTLLGCAGIWLPASTRGPVLVFGLSFLMGLQNAIVTRISDARVRTTHISGMATDIGIELGCLVDLALRHGSVAEARAYWDKLGLHGITIFSFCAGGVLGVMAYKAVGALLLLGAAAVLFSIAIPAVLGQHRNDTGSRQIV